MTERPRLVGINHVALEVGDIDEALEFYGRILDIQGVERAYGMAFIDMGDQFLALSVGDPGPPGRSHFGLVVDAGVEVSRGRFLDFRDPWGNLVQIVDYRDIQFTKAPSVLRGMGFEGLEKRPEALEELREKGLDEPG
jgi:lactoylglutathione lyase